MTLNKLDGDALKRCCGSRAWVQGMLQLNELPDRDALLSAADVVWYSLTPSDWLEAFSHHPEIGEKSASKWSAHEQSGMNEADAEIATTMRELNMQYRQKFGWIYIVCATGKTAAEMLAILRTRLLSDAEMELRNAAAEQSKITRLRLEKLLAE